MTNGFVNDESLDIDDYVSQEDRALHSKIAQLASDWDMFKANMNNSEEEDPDSFTGYQMQTRPQLAR